ncbi:MAG: aldose epimerase family protein [Bacteroidota bacterium]
MNRITKKIFGKLKDGRNVYEFTLKNLNGFEISAINYGGIITRIVFPGRDGIPSNIVLGYDTLDAYLKNPFYIGALVGRTANRIKGGQLLIGNHTYQLSLNNPPNHLHGGYNGFHNRFWDIEPDETNNLLKLSYLSPDGEGAYPGNLNIEVLYALSEENELKITYKASTDKPTPLSPTQHTYFNLSANPGETILNHDLKIKSLELLEVDDHQCPTGEFINVKNSPFDFNQFRKIGEQIDHKLLSKMRGYDHFYIFNKVEGAEKKAELWHKPSGRYLSMKSDFPGMQVYTSNFLENIPDEKNRFYQKHGAICLEAHFHPDSSRYNHFSDWILIPDEKFEHSTSYRFEIK